jgi:hypothetical protein
VAEISAERLAQLASRYSIGGPDRFTEVHVERCLQREGGPLWAVRRNGNECLNNGGGWENEPSPSERDDAFMRRCRWPDVASAMTAAQQSLPEVLRG